MLLVIDLPIIFHDYHLLPDFQLFCHLIYVFALLLISVVGEKSPLNGEKNVASVHHKRREETCVLDKEDGRSPKENGEHRSNGIQADSKSDRIADRQPDIVDDHPGKSRSTFNSCYTSLFMLTDSSRSGILLKVNEQEPKL